MAKQPLRWGRILIGALVGEFLPVFVLILIVVIYSVAWAPQQSDEHYQEFAELAGSFVGPILGSLMTFLMAWWVCRPLQGAHILHGGLVGALVTAMGVSILLAAQAEFHFLFVVSYCLKITAGVGGGWLAQRRFDARPHGAEKENEAEQPSA